MGRFRRQVPAYDGGDYATTVREWRESAKSGHAETQTALAGLYQRGEGIAGDPGLAAKWCLRAARQGEAVAQLNLGEIYTAGRGVGRDWAREQESGLGMTISAAQRAEEGLLVRAFQPQPE